MAEISVLIIGAGPAGLSLARVLKALNVACTVFERDSGINVRSQGWAVALRESVRRLITILPEEFGDIDTTSVNAATGILDTGAVINAHTNTRLGYIGGHAKDHPAYMLRARREGLRDYLSHGLDIQYDKHFLSFQEDEAGVTATFKDGSTYRGSILVGSDGASSRARSQLLQNQQSEHASLVPIVGMFKLTSVEEVTQFQAIASAVFIACTDKVRYMAGLLSTAPDRSWATGYYAVCYKPAIVEHELKWLDKASKADLYEKALEQTASIDSTLTKYILISGVDGIVNPALSFREFLPPISLPNSRVTLIGDSLHSMMPLRGAGANTAILDACDLAESIGKIEHLTERDDVVRCLQEYAHISCPRGRDVVAATHSAGEDMHMTFGIEKDLAQRLAEILPRL